MSSDDIAIRVEILSNFYTLCDAPRERPNACQNRMFGQEAAPDHRRAAPRVGLPGKSGEKLIEIGLHRPGDQTL